MANARIPIVILGAGPAGLGAALKLAGRGGFEVTVLERGGEVGGNAGSFDLAGQAVDYGSHRLHPACAPEILADIGKMLGPDLLDRPRHGRIRLRGRWVHFPLKPLDLARHLPWDFTAGTLYDALAKREGGGPESFASVLERGMGTTICRDFYFPYARKIWGVEPEELDAEQARRRVGANSVGKLARKLLNAVPGLKAKGAGRFYYPRGGYGQISEAYAEAGREAGAAIKLRANVSGIELGPEPGATVRATYGAGMAVKWPARQVLSTIPIPVLARLMTPQAPEAVLEAACQLKYRAMILIYAVLGTDRFTEFDAHYFPGPEVAFTRLSEPRNYGLNGVEGQTVLCAELPCMMEDAVWKAPEAELGKLLVAGLEAVGLPVKCEIRSVVARRLPQAYPIYARGYAGHFARLDDWVAGLEGVVTLGRQGLFAHDNTHHTLAMAYAAAECLDDEGRLDLERWSRRRKDFEKHVVED
jgi:protoporphyrinogen oxidase